MKRRHVIAMFLVSGWVMSPVLAKDKKKEPEAPAPVNQPGQLSPDAVIKLMVVGNYKSGDAKKGDRVNLRVDDDVVDVKGEVLVRKGTAAFGEVTASRRSGIFGKRGLLDVAINYTTAVDGTKVPLRATKSRAGKSNAGVTIATAVLFAPVALFIKGGNVTLKEGTQILAYVDDTVKVSVNGSGEKPPVVAVGKGPLKVLVLRNGDTITGRIDSLADGIYTVVTENGTLAIKAETVKEIKDAAPSM